VLVSMVETGVSEGKASESGAAGAAARGVAGRGVELRRSVPWKRDQSTEKMMD